MYYVHNLPGVEIVGPAGGTTVPMTWVGLTIVEVVGLTISFLVAVETVPAKVEVGRIPLGSMLMKVPGGNFLVLVVVSSVWVGAISLPKTKGSLSLGLRL